jgi:hypothetical protein
MSDGGLYCETCERSVAREAATRSETIADLDPTKWQALCCPGCGRKLKTVFVARDELAWPRERRAVRTPRVLPASPRLSVWRGQYRML